MKAITTTLYVCGGLMVAAAVMGAVDYSSARHKGILDKLYSEEKQTALPVVSGNQLDLEDYSRGEINRPDEKTAVMVPARKVAVNKAIAKIEKKKKRKRVSFKEFSRAAIPEEIIPLTDSVVVKK